MAYRRRHRWFRRMALGLAFASVMVAGRASVATANLGEGTEGSRYVTAGGWSGMVDMESGIALSAGIPHGDEQFIESQVLQVRAGAAAQADDDQFRIEHATEARAQGGLSGYLIDVADPLVDPAQSHQDPLTTDEQAPLGARPDGDEIAVDHALEVEVQRGHRPD